jgi:hypothetical protein
MYVIPAVLWICLGVAVGILDDHVCRDVQASCCFSYGLRTGGFVQAVGLLFIRAEEREQPLNADIGVDVGQIRRQLAIHLLLLGEIPLDAEQGHRDLLLKSTAGGVSAAPSATLVCQGDVDDVPCVC